MPMSTADALQTVIEYMREAIKFVDRQTAENLTEACDILEDIAVNQFGDE
jgi:hypothetical protein